MNKHQQRTAQDYEEETGHSLTVYQPQMPSTFVPPDRVTIVPSRHEVIDPYAHAPGLETATLVSHYNANPGSRAWAMLIKTSGVTIFLALLTGAAMVVFASDFYFFSWLALASLEWIVCFFLLAIFDFRETPAAHVRQKLDGYLDLMRREQRARLKHLYGYEED